MRFATCNKTACPLHSLELDHSDDWGIQINLHEIRILSNCYYSLEIKEIRAGVVLNLLCLPARSSQLLSSFHDEAWEEL
jgi:hypothetical protein